MVHDCLFGAVLNKADSVAIRQALGAVNIINPERRHGTSYVSRAGKNGLIVKSLLGSDSRANRPMPQPKFQTTELFPAKHYFRGDGV